MVCEYTQISDSLKALLPGRDSVLGGGAGGGGAEEDMGDFDDGEL